MERKSRFSLLVALSLAAIFMLFTAACSSAEPTEAQLEEEGEHEEAERIPNDGAAIRILSPAGGATFAVDEDVRVEIEVENFVLGEDGSHWNVYVDGEEWAEVEGGDTTYALRGLEPGEHEISVFLSLGTHEQLEDGDSVTILIE